MNFIIRKEENYSYIKVVKDRLDSFISPELKAELVMLSGKGICNIVLDLSDCINCDSSGLSAMLVGNRLCDDSEGTFIICNLCENVKRIIKMAVLDTVFLITSSHEEAERLLIKKTELQ